MRAENTGAPTFKKCTGRARGGCSKTSNERDFMAKKKGEEALILNDVSEDERITKEYERLRELYSDIEGNKLKLALKLIARAAFMSVTLEDLEQYISTHGCTEEYQNGANQHGKKKSSEVEVYNAMVKNYTAIIRELTGLLPQTVNESEDDGFETFINGRED